MFICRGVQDVEGEGDWSKDHEYATARDKAQYFGCGKHFSKGQTVSKAKRAITIKIHYAKRTANQNAGKRKRYKFSPNNKKINEKEKQQQQQREEE